MRSIKTKLIVCFGVLLLVICIGLGLISYNISSNALISNLNENLPQMAQQSAKTVQSRVENQLNALEAIAAEPQISDMNNSWGNKEAILKAEVKRSGHIRMYIADENGDAETTDDTKTNIKDRDYFKKAMAGEKSVSDPTLSKTTNSMVLVYAAPIKNGDKVVGVLAATRDGNALSDMTKDITFGKIGQAFMINKQGTTVAHIDKDLVLKGDNVNENVKKNPNFKPLADIEKKMMNGESGIGEYTHTGVSKYLGYAPVKGTNWSIAITAQGSDVLKGANVLKIWVSVLSVIFIIAGIILVYMLSNSITKNLIEAVKYLSVLTTGDLSGSVSLKGLKNKDETGELSRAIKTMQESIVSMISTVKTNSSEISSHADNLSATSEEMSSSSNNIAVSMQDVAKGASTQAENLVNITTTLNKFGEELGQINNSIKEVDSNAKGINTMSTESNAEMEKLAESMNTLSNSFNDFVSKTTGLGENIDKINEITDLINSIAEQTNLLALNAAIEAARAGEAGKGFSVVAEEIRELAEQTTESSKNISNLIKNVSNDSKVMVKSSEDIKEKLTSQISVVNTAIESFKKIVSGVSNIGSKIKAVNDFTENINDEKSSILEKVEGISAVSEEVSASSEEIAASSEEMNASSEEVAATAHTLASMTDGMNKEVSKFKI
ncbi:methyl-accepting chemotaxis protein [Clostridium sp. AWRP]|uniref:methyl-accepting chemotaxis protein n=1 Tax=Clostridium sp. AWRP TaxID=2212991 RepID=UPI000FD6F998|nr:methyl-accepting chemotaxis protein [Clostridium sp. AWRP]AZV57664.1 methyl-accepting chemotaxis protein [Clostridium sp. AWRP]